MWIVDAHVYLENQQDQVSVHPSTGMEIAFRGANVVGAIVQPTHRKFYPKLDPSFLLKSKQCILVDEKLSTAKLKSELGSGRYQCMTLDRGEAKKDLSNGRLDAIASFGTQFGIPLVLRPEFSYRTRTDASQLKDLKQLIRKYPKTNFVFSRLGIPDEDVVANWVQKLKNVYVDTAGLLQGNYSVKAQMEVEEFVRRPLRKFVWTPRKVLFGSGWPNTTIMAFIEIIKEEFPKGEWDHVFYQNAIDVYNMKIQLSHRRYKQDMPGGREKVARRLGGK